MVSTNNSMKQPTNNLVLLALLAVVGYLVYTTFICPPPVPHPRPRDFFQPSRHAGTQDAHSSVAASSASSSTPGGGGKQGTPPPARPEAAAPSAVAAKSTPKDATQQYDDKCGSGNYLATALLPKADPKFKDWSDLAPSGPMQGMDMLLDPVKVIGYDTVSNQLRNASYDLRKEPQNPTQAVSPWINSTIGPDLMRKPLEDCRTWSMPDNRQH